MCMQCAKIDHESDCQGGVKGYSFHGARDPVTGQRYIVCDNTPGTCRHSLCLCDQVNIATNDLQTNVMLFSRGGSG